MRAARKRLKAEVEDRTAHAWQTAAFTGATQSQSGLKPLDHYLKRPPRPMSHAEMLANMQALMGVANTKYEIN